MVNTQMAELTQRNGHSTHCAPILRAKTGLDLELNLLQAVANGDKKADFLLWRCQQSLVMPKSYIGWPIVLRETGGDLTPQCPGILNVALVFRSPKDAISIRDSYLHLCNPIIKALSQFGINAHHGSINGAFCDGQYNVTVNNKKIAGTAQRWKNVISKPANDVAILVQAAILIDGPFSQLWQISNEFYQRCQIDYYIEEDKHIALDALLGESGDKLIHRCETHLINALENWLKDYSQT